MERFAADGMKAERDHAVRTAVKSDMPWTEIMDVYGLSIAEIMEIADSVPRQRQPDDIKDAVSEIEVVRRGRR